MNTKRSFYLMIATVVFLFCLLVTSAVLGDLWLKKQSQKLLAVKLDNRLIDEQQSALVQANKDIQKYADLEKIANTIVPQDKDQAKTVREIVSLANANNIPISSIAFPSSTLGTTSAPASSSASSSGSASSSSSSSSASSSSSGSASGSTTPAVTTPSITQVTPVTGMAGLYQMTITIQSNNTLPVSYDSFISFLKALENNRHTAQVSTMTIIPYSKDISKLTFTLGITVYIRP